MSKEWDRENMRTVGANLRKEDAEGLKELAQSQGSTIGGVLRNLVQQELNKARSAGEKSVANGVPHILTYKNTDRLKAEVAFYNPKGLNPDAMLNDILDRYFELASSIRTKG